MLMVLLTVATRIYALYLHRSVKLDIAAVPDVPHAATRGSARWIFHPYGSGGSTPRGSIVKSGSISDNLLGYATALGIACAYSSISMRTLSGSYSWKNTEMAGRKRVTLQKGPRCYGSCPALRDVEGPRDGQLI
jgi:hypothetical protein